MRPWICVAYSAPVAAASAVFLVYPFGQGVSPMLCLLVFLVLLTTCLYSKQNTISLCTRSTCSVLLGYSVDLFSLLCMEVWLLLRWFVKPQKLIPELWLQVRSRRRDLQHRRRSRLLRSFDLPIRFFQQLPFLALLPCCGCCWHLVHRTWCFHDGVQPERFQLQPVHHRWSRSCAQHLGRRSNRAGLGMEVMQSVTHTTSHSTLPLLSPLLWHLPHLQSVDTVDNLIKRRPSRVSFFML